MIDFMKHFDAYLYATIAVAGSITVSLGTDEAFNLFSPQTLFWSKSIMGATSAGALAIKMYRSTTFAKSQADAEPDSVVTTTVGKESIPPQLPVVAKNATTQPPVDPAAKL